VDLAKSAVRHDSDAANQATIMGGSLT